MDGLRKQAAFRPRGFVRPWPQVIPHTSSATFLSCSPSFIMFSKVLAFGLGALALVRAAPAFSFQTPMLSCNVNLDAAVAPVTSNAIQPGQYKIYNEAFGYAQLRSYSLNEPIFVSYTREEPGPFGMWNVIQTGSPGSNEYKIVNLGLSGVTRVSQAR
ncbi:hypothetical protein MSAN_01069400 [Mycena sanguinolenta]|uniref:Uncharacterized protein n=1 Tax=Mycena sanguinolenta TaxID=230812 RepID=A0A8H7D6H7_9AGAR|nr:hypothetical protein MSAN_01069400 [Mycena sanguinolenta]